MFGSPYNTRRTKYCPPLPPKINVEKKMMPDAPNLSTLNLGGEGGGAWNFGRFVFSVFCISNLRLFPFWRFRFLGFSFSFFLSFVFRYLLFFVFSIFRLIDFHIFCLPISVERFVGLLLKDLSCLASSIFQH